MARSPGRGGHAWRKLQERVFRTETYCALCGEYVDQTLGINAPMSRTVDHKVALNLAPHLALARTNVQLAHRVCNQRKGEGGAPMVRTPTSRKW